MPEHPLDPFCAYGAAKFRPLAPISELVPWGKCSSENAVAVVWDAFGRGSCGFHHINLTRGTPP